METDVNELLQELVEGKVVAFREVEEVTKRGYPTINHTMYFELELPKGKYAIVTVTG